jgi:hypothetical protein
MDFQRVAIDGAGLADEIGGDCRAGQLKGEQRGN